MSNSTESRDALARPNSAPIRLIFLGGGLTTEISPEDADLMDRKWVAVQYKYDAYAARHKWSGGRGGRAKRTFLAREIAARMGPVDGLVVDHINGDTLDNRRSNLRAVPQSVNLRNTDRLRSNNASGHVGVQFYPNAKKGWRAFIVADGKRYALGSFVTKEEAIEARLRGEVLHWGIEPRRAKAHAA